MSNKLTPEEQLQLKLAQLQDELDAVNNKLQQATASETEWKFQAKLSKDVEKRACDMYEQEELRVAQLYKEKLLQVDIERRQVSDWYRKNGLLQVNDDLTPETQASIESRGLAHITDISLLTGLVDLHGAHMRMFAEQLRKCATDIQIGEERKKRNIKAKKLVEDERNDPKVARAITKEEIEKREELTKLANGDKAYRKALKGLIDAGRSTDDAIKMLSLMGMTPPVVKK